MSSTFVSSSSQTNPSQKVSDASALSEARKEWERQLAALYERTKKVSNLILRLVEVDLSLRLDKLNSRYVQWVYRNKKHLCMHRKDFLAKINSNKAVSDAYRAIDSDLQSLRRKRIDLDKQGLFYSSASSATLREIKARVASINKSCPELGLVFDDTRMLLTSKEDLSIFKSKNIDKADWIGEVEAQICTVRARLEVEASLYFVESRTNSSANNSAIGPLPYPHSRQETTASLSFSRSDQSPIATSLAQDDVSDNKFNFSPFSLPPASPPLLFYNPDDPPPFSLPENVIKRPVSSFMTSSLAMRLHKKNKKG